MTDNFDVRAAIDELASDPVAWAEIERAGGVRSDTNPQQVIQALEEERATKENA